MPARSRHTTVLGGRGGQFNASRGARTTNLRTHVSGKATPNKGLLTFDREILDREVYAAAGLRTPDGVVSFSKSPNREMAQANHALASIAIEYIVETLARRIADHDRAQRVPIFEGALVRALREPENIQSDAEGFTVVVDSVMDDSAAGKYYRNLEYGSDVFVGRVIEGFFLEANGRPMGPQEGSKTAVRLIQAGNFTNRGPKSQAAGGPALGRGGRKNPAGRFESGAGDTFHNSDGSPSSLRFTESARTKGTFAVNNSALTKSAAGKGQFVRANGKTVQAHKIIIKNPIPAYEYIRDGLRKFRQQAEGPDGLIQEAYALALERYTKRGLLTFGDRR